jgi:hypothetical protein
MHQAVGMFDPDIVVMDPIAISSWALRPTCAMLTRVIDFLKTAA